MAQAQQHVLTSLDEDGRSYFYDLPAEQVIRDVGFGTSTHLYTLPSFPPDVSHGSSTDLDATAKNAPTGVTTGRVVPAGGLNNELIIIAPGSQGPVHRTRTVDIGMIHEGEVELHLDEGVRILRAGDTFVLRAPRHHWVNKSDKVVKIFGVAIDAQKLLDGKGNELKEEGMDWL